VHQHRYAEQSEKPPFGKQLAGSSQYFPFSVYHGMAALQMDDWKEIERMDALTTKYLGKPRYQLFDSALWKVSSETTN
jgi:hypothetical protein